MSIDNEFGFQTPNAVSGNELCCDRKGRIKSRPVGRANPISTGRPLSDLTERMLQTFGHLYEALQTYMLCHRIVIIGINKYPVPPPLTHTSEWLTGFQRLKVSGI